MSIVPEQHLLSLVTTSHIITGMLIMIDPNTQAPSTGLKFEVNKKQSQVFCIRLTVTLNRLLVISNLDLILLF